MPGKSQAVQRSLLPRSLGPSVCLLDLTLQALRFPASLSPLPDPVPPEFPRGVGSPALAFPLSPRQDLGAVVTASPDPPQPRGVGCQAGARPGHAQSAQVQAAAAVGEEEEEGAVAAAVRSRARAELRSLLPAGARPCPQVAGSRARRRLFLAALCAYPAAVAGSRTHIPRTPTPDVKRDSSPSTPGAIY
ncbi:hypothetical protein mRhiFer1_009911 [Rhinolophus ferrumequinum]|uniref:Uncharacterized protein n=1 Tax=Rhinolophus ferrumequinum TaxID=59479 RepID=A0A7J7YI88_RHIFE|nr:hypothetical protein mRhiFer1_009911 [Rhinolophus ferrumequinum]